MKPVRVLGVFVMAVAVLAGCGKKAKIPDELRTLGDQFRSRAGSDRIELGKRIRELLPTAITRQTTGHGATVVASRPSYVLTRKDVTELLGYPEELYEGDFYYRLGEDEKYRYGLLVQFDNDHVMMARFDVEDKRIKRKK